jgi:hypothetical protein
VDAKGPFHAGNGEERCHGCSNWTSIGRQKAN